MKAAVIGAGLAGCEAAWQLNMAGIDVELYEMKPEKHSPAHKTDLFAELVCSNSLKAQRLNSAAGLLKEEMRTFSSVCVETALETSVPAGGALAVDRDLLRQDLWRATVFLKVFIPCAVTGFRFMMRRLRLYRLTAWIWTSPLRSQDMTGAARTTI